jgi:hypothetical protein
LSEVVGSFQTCLLLAAIDSAQDLPKAVM